MATNTMADNFKSVLGMKFKDEHGDIYQSWQMVNERTGTAYAILDLTNGQVSRYLCADSHKQTGSDWSKRIIANYKA